MPTTHAQRRRIFKNRRGNITVLAALFMVAMMAMLAFSIDVGVLGMVRTDLQRSADAGALAAAAHLVDSPAIAITEGKKFATMNGTLGANPSASDVKIEIGTWNKTSRTFSPNAEPADAVRVVVDRKNVPLFFGQVLTSSKFDSQASAVAAFQPRDIMLVLDYSGSMLDDNKIGNLKSSVNLFCNLVQSTSGGRDRVGFVRYSTNATLERGLTNNVTSVSTAAQKGEADGFTNIGDAMKLGIKELKDHGRPRARKIIVLLTDGLANRPTNVDPVAYVKQQAQSAANEGFPTVAVSFGSDADESLMAFVADKTKGVHFHVENSPFGSQEEQLESVFKQVAFNRRLALVD